MSLKVIGPRVLIRPMVPVVAETAVVTTDRELPVLGEVIGIGVSPCGECGGDLLGQFYAGMVVMVPPTAGQELTVDGVACWIVMASDVIAEWKRP